MRREQTPLKRRRTKIVATLGPLSSDGDTVERLIRAGVNVFRLNFSHGDHASHEAAIKEVRRASQHLDVPVGVLADLCGPKIRVGRFAGGQIDLADGEVVTVTTRPVEGGPELIPSQYPELAEDLHAGCRILLADGLLELRVDAIAGTELTCTIVHGGVLKDRKGMNLPGVALSTPCLTSKDCEDAQFAAAAGVDYFALSFVRRAADIDELRGLLGDPEAKIIAKIEHPAALDSVDAIVQSADGIMVARGDLGVELPAEEVPVVQRELVLAARSQRKAVIVATQMLESMIDNPQPTRAEVSDVSTAVFSGADAVMLSAETASGRFPVESVAMMDRIARRIESNLWSAGGFLFPDGDVHEDLELEGAVATAVAQLSRDVGVRAIVVFSESGRTARVLCAARPAAPLLAVTRSERTLLQMALLWGVEPRLVADASAPERRAVARKVATELGMAQPGQRILAVSGFEDGREEFAPQLTVLTV